MQIRPHRAYKIGHLNRLEFALTVIIAEVEDTTEMNMREVIVFIGLISVAFSAELSIKTVDVLLSKL